MSRKPKDQEDSVYYPDETERFKVHCFQCGAKNIRMTRIIEGIKFREPYIAKTKNHIGICPNKKCFRYHDPLALKGWIADGQTIVNEQQMGGLITNRVLA